MKFFLIKFYFSCILLFTSLFHCLFHLIGFFCSRRQVRFQWWWGWTLFCRRIQWIARRVGELIWGLRRIRWISARLQWRGWRRLQWRGRRIRWISFVFWGRRWGNWTLSPLYDISPWHNVCFGDHWTRVWNTVCFPDSMRHLPDQEGRGSLQTRNYDRWFSFFPNIHYRANKLNVFNFRIAFQLIKLMLKFFIVSFLN